MCIYVIFLFLFFDKAGNQPVEWVARTHDIKPPDRGLQSHVHTSNYTLDSAPTSMRPGTIALLARALPPKAGYGLSQ